MKEKKSIKNLAIILTFILLFQYVSIIVPFLKNTVEAREATDTNGITYCYTVNYGSNYYMISYYVNGEVGENLEIPERLSNWSVKEVKGIFTEEDGTEHGKEQAKNVKKVTIPALINKISYRTFDLMENLEEIIVDANNQSYLSEDGVLYNKDKTELIKCPQAKESFTIPNTVTTISSAAFQGCNKLTSINIPSTVTSLGDEAFKGCSALTTITLPDNINSIEYWNLDGCDNLANINVSETNPYYTSIDGILYRIEDNIKKLIKCPPARETINIPSDVAEIGYQAFRDCAKLTQIEIPETITQIGNNAFENCRNLTQVNIPNNIHYIPWGLFSGCSKLETYQIPNNITEIRGKVFENSGLTSITIPDHVEEIGEGVFSGCKNLTTVKLSNSLKKIPDFMFSNCSSIENIEIPDGVEEIGGGAFQKCTNLKTIKIPNSVKTFSWNVFKNDSDASDVCNVVILCEKDSKAYEYAREHSIPCIIICKVKFENEAIYNRVKEQLGEKLVKEDPATLTLTLYNSVESLDISSLELRNIDWLKDFENLNTLNASNNKISNIDVLDNLNIENLNLNNQTIEIEALKNVIDMPNVLIKAKDGKYSNNETVTYTVNDNAELIDNDKKIRVTENFGFGEGKSANITVNNGCLNGTVCIIKPAENISVDTQMNGDMLKIRAYKNNTEEIHAKDIDLYYNFNETHYESDPYAEPIKLSGQENTITIKFFDRVFDPVDININMKVTAVRRNGKIYIYANGRTDIDKNITYSFIKEGDYLSYTEPIENADKQVIYVKIGNEEQARTIEIQEINYDLSDIHDAYKKKENYVHNNTDRNVAVREDGVVRILTSAIDSNDFVYYSFDKKNWTRYDMYWQNQLYFENIAADKIYIKTEKYLNNMETEASATIYCFKIYDYYDEKDQQLLGSYNENDESYIFGRVADFEKHIRTYTSGSSIKEYNSYDIINDDIEVQRYTDGKIIDMTSVAQNIFVLKQDGNIYKTGKNYNDLEKIEILELVPEGQEQTEPKFNQINGVYALDNDNQIWEMTYIDNGYKYVKKYTEIGNTIQKVCQVLEGDGVKPFILYTNGTAVIINSDNTEKRIADNVIDISSNNENYYAVTANNLIYNGEEINLFSIAGKGEVPVKINAQGSILTNTGNYYEMNIYYSNAFIDEITKSNAYDTDNYAWKKIEVKSIREDEIDTDVFKKIVSITYPDTPNKTGITRLGDYSYRNNSDDTYYMITGLREAQGQIENVQDNDIVITKDETKLSDNKVIININVTSNKNYTVTSLDNLEALNAENGFKYLVTKNGEYVFEFKDSSGNTKIRVVHVKTIQNRKITKVPEVISLNGKIRFESDEEIEYSFDKENWTAYDKNSELTYTQPIYTRICNDAFECSILKVSLNDNREIVVDNTERREIQEEILTNALGAKHSERRAMYETIEDNKDPSSVDNKEINYRKNVDNKEADASASQNKNLFEYISEIADRIIYSFSATDREYAGCYYGGNETRLTYKDIDNNVKVLNNEVEGITTNSNIEYSVTTENQIITNVIERNEENTEAKEQEKVARGEIISYFQDTMETVMPSAFDGGEDIVIRKDVWVEKIGYNTSVYIDSDGNLVSDNDVIVRAKEEIQSNNPSAKFVKIVGDKNTFYILTDQGRVYLVSKNDSFAKDYFLKKRLDVEVENTEFLMYKLDLNNIVDIYDTCTARTKDGKIVSLLEDNYEDTSIVQQLQSQTDKYLAASHLGLKDGKLYDFDNVSRGVEVTAGKVVKTEDKEYGIYLEDKQRIKLFDNIFKTDDYNTEENIDYIDVQPSDEELPYFIDIAEYRDCYLTFAAGSWNVTNYTEEYIGYDNTDKYAVCYAISKDGEVWIYLGGYIIDTGVNLDYFGPTTNYTLNETNWTNQNVELDFTENTYNNSITAKIRKGSEVIAENRPVTIEKNGDYSIEITDSKGRSDTTLLRILNIDKLEPIVDLQGNDLDRKVIITVSDQNATQDYAKSGINNIKYKYSGDSDWQTIETHVDEQGNTVGTIDLRYYSDLSVMATDNAGNTTQIARTFTTYNEPLPGELTVRYVDENGTSIKNDVKTVAEVGSSYKITPDEIKGYTYVGSDKNLEGKYTKEAQIITLKYKKIVEPKPEIGKVIVRYQDLDGMSLKKDDEKTGEVGTNYIVEPAKIDGYKLVETIGNESGKYAKQDQEVIYKYEKIKEEPKEETGRVIVKYQDEKGNALEADVVIKGKVGESYKAEKKEIYKYKLKEVIGNEEGKIAKEDQEVIYKYEKVNGRIIVEYIDPDGNPIQEEKIIEGKVDDPYKVSRLEIEGYELIEVIGNEEGVYKVEDQRVSFKYKKIEKPTMPKTGQTRIAYIILGFIIIISIATLGYYNMKQ